MKAAEEITAIESVDFRNAVLVPIPSSKGSNTRNKALAAAIQAALRQKGISIDVVEALKKIERTVSVRDTLRAGKPAPRPDELKLSNVEGALEGYEGKLIVSKKQAKLLGAIAGSDRPSKKGKKNAVKINVKGISPAKARKELKGFKMGSVPERSKGKPARRKK